MSKKNMKEKKVFMANIDDLKCEGCGKHKKTSLFRSVGRLCESCKLIAFNKLMSKKA